jgi:hypothetical protein
VKSLDKASLFLFSSTPNVFAGVHNEGDGIGHIFDLRLAYVIHV